MKKILFMILAVSMLSFAAFGQDIQTRGSIKGTVTDPNGAVLTGATVTVSGPTGDRTVTTGDNGLYEVTNLIPGTYTVRVTQSGFKTASVSNTTVFVGRATTVDTRLEIGESSAVVNVTAGSDIDQSSTAIGSNLNDDLFENIPVQRSVTGLFYLAPGVGDSLGGGRDNPSIAGGSPLDNLYIADGVNITDSAFGGIGTFTRVYGSLGTGINTSFIKEVQVKTGGFEPQYGQAQGGIVNIITQSGGNEYHGALYGYLRPEQFEATRRQRDHFSTNKIGELLKEENYDFGADLGGHIVKDKLFFFGSFNPSFRRDVVLGAQGSGLRTLLGEHKRKYKTWNYAGKLDWNLNSSNVVSFSIFGDPTKTNLSSFNNLNIDNTTAQSILDFGTRNMALRYNGTITPTWTLSASFSHGKNEFDETGFENVYQITDLTQTGGLPGQRGSFVAQGLGFFEPTESNTYRGTIDTSKTFSFLGQHTFGIGYQYQRAFYEGTRDRSGPKSLVPATNAFGISTALLGGGAAQAIGQATNNSFSLRLAPAACTQCPFMNVPGLGQRRVYLLNDRGEFGNTSFKTQSNYHAGYIQDTWRLNRFLTVLLGLRTEQERLIGSPNAAGVKSGYSFTGQWAPRLGVTFDPLGKGKTKIYYSFGRFFEFIPLDLAERSLSSESDFRSAEFIPDFTGTGTNKQVVINPATGTVTPIFDAAHLVSCGSGAPGSPQQNCRDAGYFPSTVSTSVTSATAILAGTKLGYTDEHLLGFEQQLPRNFTLSVRYQDKRIQRIVEDAALVAPESADFFGQAYFIGNISSTLDAATNPISRHFTPGGTPPPECDEHLINSDLGVCYLALGVNGQPAGDFIPDGVADGFPDPKHVYRALEFEINKRFSSNWMLLSNYRMASLKGNFEGHYRNDNGQTDPAISSLFDFTEGEFNLLGDQTASGPLNTDRRHTFNIYPTYTFSRDSGVMRSLSGLTLGFGFHGESGVPISRLNAHPIYLNAGEIPVGGRGALGRTPWFLRVDSHVDYKWAVTEKQRLVFIADFFNITNNRRVRRVNEFAQLSGGIPNVDFLAPRNFHNPFNMRVGMRWEF
jgi:outer membrane receptor for ferrienterochelin and colicin